MLQNWGDADADMSLISFILQVDYIVNNGFIPSLEFAQPYEAYVSSESCIRFGGTGVSSNYADNRCDPPVKMPTWHLWLMASRDFCASDRHPALAEYPAPKNHRRRHKLKHDAAVAPSCLLPNVLARKPKRWALVCSPELAYVACRYWTMYKLPMFGCTDPSQVLNEISNCTKSFPDAYIRLVAFDQVCVTAVLRCPLASARCAFVCLDGFLLL